MGARNLVSSFSLAHRRPTWRGPTRAETSHYRNAAKAKTFILRSSLKDKVRTSGTAESVQSDKVPQWKDQTRKIEQSLQYDFGKAK